MNFGKKRWIALIGIALLLWVFSRIRFDDFFRVVSNAQPIYLIAGLGVTILAAFCKAVKWGLLLESVEKKISWNRCFELYCIGVFIGLITPGRVGDFSRALYLRNETGFWSAFSSVFLDRLIDIAILLSLGFFSALGLAWFFGKNVFSATLIVMLVVLVVVASFLLLRRNAMRLLLKPLLNAFVPGKHHDLFRGGFHSFYDELAKAKSNGLKLASAFLVGLICWGLTILFSFLIVLSLHANLSLLSVAMLVPLISLAELLPVTVLGLGTRETVSLFYFSLFSINAETAVAFSLLYLVLGYGFSALLGALFFSRNPIPLNFLDGS